MVFVDVGQGDCTVAVDTGSGDGLVVDCPIWGVEAAALALESLGCAKLAVIIATHSDYDHLSGLVALARMFGVSQFRINLDVLVSANEHDRAKLKSAYLSIAGLEEESAETMVGPAYVGDEGDAGSIHWFALAPTHSQLLTAAARRNPNHSSTVVRLQIGRFRALVTGDADGLAWQQIMDRTDDLHADVLRVPHHGADMATTPAGTTINSVLDAVGASWFVVSVGSNNTYGHPKADLIAALSQRCPPARIVCTEVTGLCHLRMLGTPPTPCGGSVAFEIDASGAATWRRQEIHESIVAGWATPACMATSAATSALSAGRRH